MEQGLEQRLKSLEARVLRLEGQPVATLVAETKPRKKANRRERTPEEKAIKVAQLRAGKLAARERRAAEAQREVSPEITAKREPGLKVKVHTPDELAAADAKADMAATELPEDTTNISKTWDTLTLPQRTKIAKKAGIEGKVGSSTWTRLHEMDKKAIIVAQNAKAQVAEKRGA